MIYCRINLEKTHYSELPNYTLILRPVPEQLNQIYQQYCQYKKFNSVMPIFDNDYHDLHVDVLGYHSASGELVAFSLIRKHDDRNAEAIQFAWNYQEPQLRLGIHSLESECARYQRLGYHYLYLGFADDYKKKIDGFELVGPLE